MTSKLIDALESIEIHAHQSQQGLPDHSPRVTQLLETLDRIRSDARAAIREHQARRRSTDRRG